jgi:hypothetical protein
LTPGFLTQILGANGADQGVDMLLLLVPGGPMRHEDITDSFRRFGSAVTPNFA